MDSSKFLIWEYSKNRKEWFDATELVVRIYEDENAWCVKFKDIDEYVHVSFNNLRLYENPTPINFKAIEVDGIIQIGVKKCLRFVNKYKLFFESGYTKVTSEENTVIRVDSLKNFPKLKSILNYYKQIAQYSCQSEDDAFLVKQFDDIDSVPSDSVLSLYFNKKNGKPTRGIRHTPIAPFGSNLSQLKALDMVFNNNISIIQGPPGTGKTQTILNIIANAVQNNLKVAVASNNNSAVQNIKEKLAKYKFDFMCAYLGNKENTELFFENFSNSTPEFISKRFVSYQEIEASKSKVRKLFAKENERKKLIENLKDVELEYNHFLKDNQEICFDDFKSLEKKTDYDEVLHLLVKLQEYERDRLSIFKKIEIIKALGFFVGLKFISKTRMDQILHLQNLYFKFKINNFMVQIEAIENVLKDSSFEQSLCDFTLLSMECFKNNLKGIFENKRKENYSKENFRKMFKKFMDDYPIILSSTYALAQTVNTGFMFDYLIIDESSQVNMASAILSMRVAKNLIVVGDLKQLPQIDDATIREINEKLIKEYEIENCYNCYGNNIMSSLISVYNKGENVGVPITMLKEHYRCNPEVIGFCNKEFYNNELIIYTKNENIKDKPLRLVKLVEGNHARKNPDGSGWYSDREAEEIKKLVNEKQFEDLGIISPYRYQAEIIAKKICLPEVDVSTIHKFQGREKKNIILSTVVNQSNDFVDDPNIINVAVSRAIKSFTLVASDKVTNGKTGILADLVNYIKYHEENSEIVEGSVTSVFDILYSDYEKELESFRKMHKKNEFASELIIQKQLNQLFKRKEFISFRYAMHVPIKQVFKGKFVELNNEEKSFFFNSLTHVDFLIFNKFSKKPLAAIEVDGVSYHEKKPKQKKRDALKDSIISKTDVKLLRLKTNESNEQQRIINLLNTLCNNN